MVTRQFADRGRAKAAQYKSSANSVESIRQRVKQEVCCRPSPLSALNLSHRLHPSSHLSHAHTQMLLEQMASQERAKQMLIEREAERTAREAAELRASAEAHRQQHTVRAELGALCPAELQQAGTSEEASPKTPLGQLLLEHAEAPEHVRVRTDGSKRGKRAHAQGPTR